MNYLQTLVGARDMLEVGSPLKPRAEWNDSRERWKGSSVGSYFCAVANHLTKATPGGKLVFGSRFKGDSPWRWEQSHGGRLTWLLTPSLQ